MVLHFVEELRVDCQSTVEEVKSKTTAASFRRNEIFNAVLINEYLNESLDKLKDKIGKAPQRIYEVINFNVLRRGIKINLLCIS